MSESAGESPAGQRRGRWRYDQRRFGSTGWV